MPPTRIVRWPDAAIVEREALHVLVDSRRRIIRCSRCRRVRRPAETRQMTEHTTAKCTITVAAFQYTNDPSITSCSLFLCQLNHVSREPGVELGWYIDFVSLHTCSLPFGSVESGGYEDCRLRLNLALCVQS